MCKANLVIPAIVAFLLIQALSAQQRTMSAANPQTYGSGANLPANLPPPLLQKFRTHSVHKQSTGNSTPSNSPYATGILSTLAGGAFNQNGGSALKVGMGYPTGVARNASTGDTYVAAEGINYVFRIDASGNVTVVAGNGSGGYSGDGGPATDATLNSPIALALDPAGNLYIADLGNYVIRKLNASTGIINTVVGIAGKNGYTGDGGPATSAQIGTILGMAFDKSGDLYLSDYSSYVVREVNASTGVITTVAGNVSLTGCTGEADIWGDGCPATSAVIFPIGIAVDANNNLYIANVGADIVQIVHASNGIISIFAGQANNSAPMPGYSGDGGPATSALLNSPEALTLDDSGDLYIADTGNDVIRGVFNGMIQTVAGSAGKSGFSGDGGSATQAEFSLTFYSALAVDPATHDLYIADSNNERIREVQNGLVQTVAGNGYANYFGDGGLATSAGLADPGSVAEDKAGNLYIVDSGNNVVRKVAAGNGDITTIAGTGAVGYTGDGGSAMSSTLFSPESAALDSSGDLYIADTGNNVIREVSAKTGTITTVAGLSPGATVCSTVTDMIGDGCPATAASLSYPITVSVDSGGNLYIADTFNSVIRKVTASTGIISTIAGTPPSSQNSTNYGFSGYGFSGDGGPATSAELNDPYAATLDSNGNLYIADTSNYRIREVVAATGIIQTIAGNGTNGYSGDGGSATAAEISYVYGIFTDSAGNVYIGDTGNNAIREINTSSDVISTIAGNGTAGFLGDGGVPTKGELSFPYGGMVDNTGNLYIADLGNSRIRKVQVVPTALTVALSAAASTVVYGDSLILTATFTGSTYGVAPTGTVTFNNGSTAIGTGTISAVSGAYVAIFTSTDIPVGTYSITAQYEGDTNYSSAASTATAVTITQAGTTTVLTLSAPSVSPNQSLTLTATVTPSTSGTPTGTVTFYNGTTKLGTGTLASGAASYTTTSLPTGSDVLTAQYGGDTNFTGSTSPAVTETVASPGVTVTPSATSLAVAQGGSVTDKLKITSVGGYSGTLQFSCNGLPRAATCSFQPATVALTGTGSPVNAIVTIQTTGTSTAAELRPPLPTMPGNLPVIPAAVFWMPGWMLAAIAGSKRKSLLRGRHLLVLLLLLGGIGMLTACGGGSKSSSSPTTPVTPAGTSTVQVLVTGTGGLSQSINLSLTVQ
ncbi:MAG: Ig-like domain repeat protein [Acidobacteriaceae bacterium]